MKYIETVIVSGLTLFMVYALSHQLIWYKFLDNGISIVVFYK